MVMIKHCCLARIRFSYDQRLPFLTFINYVVSSDKANDFVLQQVAVQLHHQQSAGSHVHLPLLVMLIFVLNALDQVVLALACLALVAPEREKCGLLYLPAGPVVSESEALLLEDLQPIVAVIFLVLPLPVPLAIPLSGLPIGSILGELPLVLEAEASLSVFLPSAFLFLLFLTLAGTVPFAPLGTPTFVKVLLRRLVGVRLLMVGFRRRGGGG